MKKDKLKTAQPTSNKFSLVNPAQNGRNRSESIQSSTGPFTPCVGQRNAPK